MKLTIEPTAQFFMTREDGVMLRLWEGTSEEGVPVAVLVSAVRFEGEPSDRFPHLTEIPPPGEADALRWAEEVFTRNGRSWVP